MNKNGKYKSLYLNFQKYLDQIAEFQRSLNEVKPWLSEAERILDASDKIPRDERIGEEEVAKCMVGTNIKIFTSSFILQFYNNTSIHFTL